MFGRKVSDTLRQAVEYVIDKQRALDADAETVKSLRAECH